MKYKPAEIIDIAEGLVTDKKIDSPNVPYDWIDVVGITQRPTQLDRSLYFATHADGTDGWHNAYDRRTIAQQVAQDKGWHLALETGFDANGTEHLTVTSLATLAQRLYEEARVRSNPYIVGVTGSVGKTTTVAFLEHLMQHAGRRVTRFWSKRLTPLLVQCHYINRVEEETDVVVMEYSAYGHTHVGELSQLLPPNIAFLTNIYNAHLNPGMFTSQQDIFNSKISIKPEASLGFVNQTVLDNLGISIPDGWQPFTTQTQLLAHNPLLPPTLRTAELHTVGYQLAQDLNISDATFRRAFETFVPQERRITTVNYNGHPVFFDGEVSFGSRQLSWFETLDGSCPTLLAEELNWGDEDPNGYLDELEVVFGSENSFVLDTPRNRRLLPVQAHFVSEAQFANLLKRRAGTYLVYHKAMATRVKEFNPENYLLQRW